MLAIYWHDGHGQHPQLCGSGYSHGFAARIRGRTTGERNAMVELDEHLMVVEVEAGRENEVHRGNNKHL
jgi:hypothetical protein